MAKQVTKVLYDTPYAIWRHERRFADQARIGLHLMEWMSRNARYLRGPGERTQYKIEVTAPTNCDVITNAYRLAGWKWITQFKELQVFAAPEGCLPPQVQEHGEERATLLRRINVRLVWRMLGAGAALLWGLFFMIAFHWRYEGFISGIMEDKLVVQASVLVVLIYGVVREINGYRSFRILRRHLHSGEALPAQPGWRRVHNFNALLAGLFVLGVLGNAMVLPLVRAELRETHTLKQADSILPLIRLADIERNPGLVRQEGIRVNHVDGDNRIVINWSLLAPVQYTLIELGSVPGEKWSGGGPYLVWGNREASIHGSIQDGGNGSKDSRQDYHPFLNINYYQVAFPFMAGALVQDLVHTFSRDNEMAMRQEAGFDALYVSEGENGKQLVASSGNRVVYLFYAGKKAAADLIPLLAEKLSE